MVSKVNTATCTGNLTDVPDRCAARVSVKYVTAPDNSYALLPLLLSALEQHASVSVFYIYTLQLRIHDWHLAIVHNQLGSGLDLN